MTAEQWQNGAYWAAKFARNHTENRSFYAALFYQRSAAYCALQARILMGISD